MHAHILTASRLLRSLLPAARPPVCWNGFGGADCDVCPTGTWSWGWNRTTPCQSCPPGLTTDGGGMIGEYACKGGRTHDRRTQIYKKALENKQIVEFLQTHSSLNFGKSYIYIYVCVCECISVYIKRRPTHTYMRIHTNEGCMCLQQSAGHPLRWPALPADLHSFLLPPTYRVQCAWRGRKHPGVNVPRGSTGRRAPLAPSVHPPSAPLATVQPRSRTAQVHMWQHSHLRASALRGDRVG